MRSHGWHLVWVLIFSMAVPAGAAVSISQMSQVDDAVHFEFTGQAQWQYDLKKVQKAGKTFVEVTLPPLNDDASTRLRNFKSPEIPSVRVDAAGPDGKSVVSFELSRPEIEAFDYLTDEPSRLIVDFFIQPSGEKEKKPAAQKSKTAALPKKEEPAKASITTVDSKGRSPASADYLVISPTADTPVSFAEAAKRAGIFDGGDPKLERFSMKDYEIKEESIIASRENVFLDFPMLQMPSSQLTAMMARSPLYEVTPKDTDENKQMRLLTTLFQKKRWNVFLKTVDWFMQKYPNSEYDEMVRFMWADAYFALWQEGRNVRDFDVSMLRYRQALEKYPDSPLAERTSIFMGFATMDRGDYLGTLRLFQSHIDRRPNSPNKDMAKLAIAEAFLKIQKFDEAAAEYRMLEKSGDQKKNQIAGSYLLGDVFFTKKDYPAAIEAYSAALKKNPGAAGDYPNAKYNMAASYFGLKDYRKSLDTYREFLTEFPSHPYAGYAMTRVGEILDILGADKNRVAGAYLETYFRYGQSPSASLARIRLLSQRMPGMKKKELESAVTEMEELAGKSDLPKLSQFTKILIADGLSRRGEYARARDLLVKYYQANPTSSDTALLSQRIEKYINEDIRSLVEKGSYLEALKKHNEFATTWLKGSHRMDTPFLVGQSFEQAGVFKEAETLYRETLNRLYSIRGTNAEKERGIFEKLPSTDELNLRLAEVVAAQGKSAEAYDFLKAIQKPDAMTEAQQIERVHLSARLFDQRGETESAIRYLSELLKVWKGIPALLADPYLNLAQMEIKMNRPQDAIKSLEQIGNLNRDSKEVSPVTHAKSLELLGDLQLKQGQTEQAIGTYENLLSLYESQRPLSSIRYKVGKLYFDKGQIQKASEVWSGLKNDKSPVWYQLAQENLQGSEWGDNYKKYIERIPAMSGKKTE